MVIHSKGYQHDCPILNDCRRDSSMAIDVIPHEPFGLLPDLHPKPRQQHGSRCHASDNQYAPGVTAQPLALRGCATQPGPRAASPKFHLASLLRRRPLRKNDMLDQTPPSKRPSASKPCRAAAAA